MDVADFHSFFLLLIIVTGWVAGWMGRGWETDAEVRVQWNRGR